MSNRTSAVKRCMAPLTGPANSTQALIAVASRLGIPARRARRRRLDEVRIADYCEGRPGHLRIQCGLARRNLERNDDASI